MQLREMPADEGLNPFTALNKAIQKRLIDSRVDGNVMTDNSCGIKWTSNPAAFAQMRNKIMAKGTSNARTLDLL